MKFSLEQYRRLLGTAVEAGCRFSAITDADPGPRSVFLRHDVDYSLEMATEIAVVNASFGIQATFFVLLRSEAYNLLSRESIRRIETLRAADQRIALHYTPPGDWPVDLKQLSAAVQSDWLLVQEQVGRLEPLYAWHNPTPDLIGRTQDLKVEGLTNMYGRRFMEGSFRYASDSNLRNSVEQLIEKVGELTSPLQLLLHPFNWVAGGDTMLPIFAGTWRYIIREREQEAIHNREYQQLFPEGLSDVLLNNFSEAIILEGRGRKA